MAIDFRGSPQELDSEHLIRLHRQIKSEIAELKTLADHIDCELKNRIRATGSIETPSGTAELVYRHSRQYSPQKLFGILGTDAFLEVVTISTTKLKAWIGTIKGIEPNLEGTYKETVTEVLTVN